MNEPKTEAIERELVTEYEVAKKIDIEDQKEQSL